MSLRHERSDYEIAVHETAHWLFTEWLGLDRANYVTIEEHDGHPGHTNFSGEPSISTLERCVRHSMMLLAGWAAENIFFCQGGINTLPACKDNDDFRKLAEKFFPMHPEQRRQLFRECWREANTAVRSSLQNTIKETALLLASKKTLSRQELDDVWKKVRTEIPNADTAVERILRVIKEAYP